MAAKKEENVVYVVKTNKVYLIFDGDRLVGKSYSGRMAFHGALDMGYDWAEEVSIEQWLEIILSSE